MDGRRRNSAPAGGGRGEARRWGDLRGEEAAEAARVYDAGGLRGFGGGLLGGRDAGGTRGFIPAAATDRTAEVVALAGEIGRSVVEVPPFEIQKG